MKILSVQRRSVIPGEKTFLTGRRRESPGADASKITPDSIHDFHVRRKRSKSDLQPSEQYKQPQIFRSLDAPIKQI